MVSYSKNLRLFRNCLGQLIAISFALVPLSGLVTSSGCGTEVGNGFSGPKDVPDDKRKKETGTSAKQDADPAASSEGSIGPAADSVNTDPLGVPRNETSGPVLSLEIDAAVLMAPCGSPFGEKLVSPLNLTSVEGSNISASLSGSEWALSLNSQVVGFVSASVQGSYRVSAFGPDRTASTSLYTCTSVVSSDSVVVSGIPGTVSKRAVTVTLNGSETQVTWYVKSGATVTDPKTMMRIEITDARGTKVFDPTKSP
jgi:hypothetical protein